MDIVKILEHYETIEFHLSAVHDHPGLTTMTGNNMRDGVSIDFKYNVTLDQIDILVSVSLVCRQYIRCDMRIPLYIYTLIYIYIYIYIYINIYVYVFSYRLYLIALNYIYLVGDYSMTYFYLIGYIYIYIPYTIYCVYLYMYLY